MILFQILAVQYGTYYLYSWDSIEAITFMVTMADVHVWILYDRHNYGMEGLRVIILIKSMKNYSGVKESIRKKLKIFFRLLGILRKGLGISSN